MKFFDIVFVRFQDSLYGVELEELDMCFVGCTRVTLKAPQGQVSKSINAHNSMFRLRYVFFLELAICTAILTSFLGGRCTLTRDNFHMRGTLVGSFLAAGSPFSSPTVPEIVWINPEFSGTLW